MMSTTNTSEAAANFLKTYSHDHFIKPSRNTNIYKSVETKYGSPNIYDIQLCEKVLPVISKLQFDHETLAAIAGSRKSSNSSSVSVPESIAEEREEPDWTDSSCEAGDDAEDGDQVPELVSPVYQPRLSSPPKKSTLNIEERGKRYLQLHGHERRASAPVNMTLANLKKQDDKPRPVSPLSKDECDVPETTVREIESLKREACEAAILSKAKMRQMKHLDYRRGSMPAVSITPVPKTGKRISNERVHQIMQNFYGPQSMKPQGQTKQVGVQNPAENLTNTQVNQERVATAGGSPSSSAAPVAPPLGREANKEAEFKPLSAETGAEPGKVSLTEAVKGINPSVALPQDLGPSSAVLRRSSTQDLEDTFKKMDRSSGELSDSGSFTDSGEAGTTWFGGLIGLRPVPAPRKPGESKPATAVKKKVKKRDLNAFAPAGF